MIQQPRDLKRGSLRPQSSRLTFGPLGIPPLLIKYLKDLELVLGIGYTTIKCVKSLEKQTVVENEEKKLQFYKHKTFPINFYFPFYGFSFEIAQQLQSPQQMNSHLYLYDRYFFFIQYFRLFFNYPPWVAGR